MAGAIKDSVLQETVKKMRNLHSECVTWGDEKMSLAIQAYDMVDNRIRQLDLDLRRFEQELATDPKFILLDEPFAGVDPIAVEDIQRIVYQLKQRNIGVLITDHNVQETLSITDRAYLLYDGQILKAGTAEELAADEQVRKVYLGQNFELRKNKQQVI